MSPQKQYSASAEKIRYALTRFNEVYSRENGLKSQLSKGVTLEANIDFYNIKTYLEHEFTASAWRELRGTPITLLVCICEIQEKLAKKEKPLPEELNELESLLMGVIED